MKTNIYILFTLIIFGVLGCTELDIPPRNVIQDEGVFTNNGGIEIYMARLYSEMPIEDFRYSPARGFNHFWILAGPSANTGESLSRDQGGAMTESFGGYWDDAYLLLRETNYFIESLPGYSDNFEEAEINHWLGEARFIRAFTYFALVKRYGGVPLINEVLQYPEQPVEELAVPRASEEEVYDAIAEDLDFAIANMQETSQRGRANRYVAAAFKSRAMLFAGSIAKYNQITLSDNGQRVVGIPSGRTTDYFQEAYDAAQIVEGHYSLYKQQWSAGDEQAQFQNYVNLFFDEGSSENIFVKDYMYPETVHGYDAYNVPRQLMGGNGYSSEVSPTLNYVEMFDGLPKNENGTFKFLGEDGNYLLYDDLMGPFEDAEPRLRATVIFPGDIFKGEEIEIWRGIYTGDIQNGVEPLLEEGSTSNYPEDNLVTSANASQTPYTLPDGSTMNPAGASGTFTADATSSQTGFSIRKYLDPDRPTSDVLENRSDQTWIELRYAEVLLNRAEAAYELASSGATGGNYLQDAFNSINEIRERAGADLLNSESDLSDIRIIREERRKELAFENKTWWDMKRWRIADEEQNATLYRTLMPFYAANAGEWFFDVRLDERNRRYTFDPRWYYQEIPQGAISKNQNLIQNPGY